jgi:hypothetical protein
MKAELFNWVSPNETERVIEISYTSSLDNNHEAYTGRWIDVEDSGKFKDEYYYTDYGTIIREGTIPKQRILERYNHFFLIQEEP